MRVLTLGLEPSVTGSRTSSGLESSPRTERRGGAGVGLLGSFVLAGVVCAGAFVAHADTTLEGRAVIDDEGVPKGVANVTVFNPGPAGQTGGDGSFQIPGWPDSLDPTFAFAALPCDQTVLWGLSEPTAVNVGGTTDVQDIPLLGELPVPTGPVAHSLGSGTQSDLVAAADMNDDGNTDLVVKLEDAAGHKMRILFGDGLGGFAAGPEISAVGEVASDVIAFAGGVGEGIIYYPNKTASAVSHAVYFNSQFFGPFHFSTGDPAVALGFGFWTGNGTDFIAATEPSGGGGAVVRVSYRNIQDFDPPVTLHTTAGKISALVVAKVNADSIHDIVALDRDAGQCIVLLANGQGGFVAQTPFACGVDPRDLAAADVDADGDRDLVVVGQVSSQDSTGRLTLLTNDGTGSFSSATADGGDDLRSITVGTNYMEPAKPIFAVASAGDDAALLASYDLSTQTFAITATLADSGGSPAGLALARLTDPGLLLALGAANGASHVALWTQEQFPGDGDADGLDDVDDVRRGLSCSNPDFDADGFLDGDEVAAGTDPKNPQSLPPDHDGDGLSDFTDPDDDNDGVLDEADNCRFAVNPSQSDVDGNDIGDACDRSLEVHAPQSGTEVSVSLIDVVGFVSDPLTVVQANGLPATVDSAGLYRVEDVPLSPGSNAITVTAFSGLVSRQVVVVRDEDAPVISAVQPPDLSDTLMQEVVYSGAVSGDVAALLVAGEAATLSGGSFLSRPVLLEPGVNNVEIIAFDRAGNQSQITLSIDRLSIEDQPVAQVTPETALAPATATIRIDTRGVVEANSTYRYSFGDGTPDEVGVDLDEVVHNFTTPGTYQVQVDIEQPNGPTLLAETVFSAEAPNFAAMWSGFRRDVISGDLTAAVQYAIPSRRPLLHAWLRAMDPAERLEFFASLVDPALVEYGGFYATLGVRFADTTTDEGILVEFVRDPSGNWGLLGF